MLGLKIIDVACTSRNIFKHVSLVVEEYGLSNKLFSITLDNASPNKIVMGFLKHLFSRYLGLVLLELYEDLDVLMFRLLFSNIRIVFVT